MWFIGVEVEQETSATPPKKNPGSATAKTTSLQEVIFLVNPYHGLLAGGLSYVLGLGHSNHNTSLIFTEKERNT